MSALSKVALFIIIVSLLVVACDNKESCLAKRKAVESQLTLCIATTGLIKNDAERANAQQECREQHQLSDSCVAILVSND